MAIGPNCAEDPRPSPVLRAASERRDRTLAALRVALERGGAYLVFQPVVDAGDPAVPLFHEALLRFRDGTGREVSAREFMPAAEADEIGREVDRTALRLALRELADMPDLRLSVNLSARTIGDGEWMRLLRTGCAAQPAIARRLTVELTEASSPALPCLAREVMAELRAAGIGLALDDFGTGHSSLAHLRDYRFDILKIDGRFVRGIEDDPDSAALVTSMLGLARHFGMLAVVERVETRAEADALRALGAGGFQGYLHGRPTARPAWRRANLPTPPAMPPLLLTGARGR